MVQNIVSFSGGKDSSAMLLRMVELNYKIDKIIFADTTLEFPEMYEWIKYIEKLIKIKIEILKPKHNFNDWFYGNFTKGIKKGQMRGFPLSFGKGCHLRGAFKVNQLSRMQKTIDNIFIGFAKDEELRSKLSIYKNTNFKFPLIEWGWSEQDCVQYLKKRKVPFPFFDRKRTGCWLCPQQNMSSLKILMNNYPNLWRKLKQLEKDSPHGFKPNFKLSEFETKYKKQKRLF